MSRPTIVLSTYANVLPPTQQCAISKVKCNLQSPCLRCTERKKDCVYGGAARQTKSTSLIQRFPQDTVNSSGDDSSEEATTLVCTTPPMTMDQLLSFNLQEEPCLSSLTSPGSQEFYDIIGVSNVVVMPDSADCAYTPSPTLYRPSDHWIDGGLSEYASCDVPYYSLDQIETFSSGIYSECIYAFGWQR